MFNKGKKEKLRGQVCTGHLLQCQSMPGKARAPTTGVTEGTAILSEVVGKCRVYFRVCCKSHDLTKHVPTWQISQSLNTSKWMANSYLIYSHNNYFGKFRP